MQHLAYLLGIEGTFPQLAVHRLQLAYLLGIEGTFPQLAVNKQQ